MGLDENTLRASVGEVFKHAGGKKVDIPTYKSFDDWGDMNSMLPKTAPNKPKAKALEQTVRRNKKFKERSKASVGVGLRSANGAGRGHTSFGSTRLA